MASEYLYYYNYNREAMQGIRTSEATRGFPSPPPVQLLPYEREATYMAEGRHKEQEHARNESTSRASTCSRSEIRSYQGP
jgi:hypothetical protein